MAVLERKDPELAAIIAREEERQSTVLEMIASENYTSAAVIEAAGHRPHQQVRRGLSGQALLRRLRVRRRGREARHRPRQAALRRRARQRPAPLRRRRPTWPSTSPLLEPGDTSWACDLAHGGHLTHGRSSTSPAGSTTSSTTASTARPSASTIDEIAQLAKRAQAEDDRGRRERLPARSSTSPRSPRSPTRSGALLDGRHGPHRRAGRRRRSTRQPGAVRRRRHDHHAQDAARPARRPGPVQARSMPEAIDKAVFPGIQGGPLMHIIAGKAVCFGEALEPGVQGLRRAGSSRTPRRWPRRCKRSGFRLVSGGTDNHLMLVDVAPQGHHRQARRAGARRGRHHRQQEHDPLRPATAAGSSAASASARRR